MPPSSSDKTSNPDLNESYTKMSLTSTAEDPTLIGSHCQYTYCNQLDFLPFRCESCGGTFCLDHRSESSHTCSNAGAWAARKRAAELARPSIGANGRSTLEVEVAKPCACPSCKTMVGKGLQQGVRCGDCHRLYCLSHRLKEDHDCKNLVPLGARPAGKGAQTQAKAFAALGKLKAWGTAKKDEIAKASTRSLPKAKPSSASARILAVNALKKSAKGDDKLGPEKRVYLYVEAESETTRSKYPKGNFFYNKEWVVGRLLDAAAKSLMVENVNNQSAEETDKLRVFHVEGGRVLEFNEKVGVALQSGNTIVLLRGVGPAIPDLITV